LSGRGCCMVMVTKRDGRTEAFVPEKVVVSAIKAGAPPEVARAAARKIEKEIREGESTREIQKKVLSMLKADNPLWEQNWRVFDTAVKKRSG